MTDTEIPTTRRSGSTDELARGNSWHEPKIQKQMTTRNYRMVSLQFVPDWLQELKHGLLDESVP